MVGSAEYRICRDGSRGQHWQCRAESDARQHDRAGDRNTASRHIAADHAGCSIPERYCAKYNRPRLYFAQRDPWKYHTRIDTKHNRTGIDLAGRNSGHYNSWIYVAERDAEYAEYDCAWFNFTDNAGNQYDSWCNFTQPHSEYDDSWNDAADDASRKHTTSDHATRRFVILEQRRHYYSALTIRSAIKFFQGWAHHRPARFRLCVCTRIQGLRFAPSIIPLREESIMVDYVLRVPTTEPSPPPVQEPTEPPENPDVPVREPEPDVPNQI